MFMVTKMFNEDERLPIIPTDINKDLKDLLNKCFIADEKTRWSAAQLAEHVFFSPKSSSAAVKSKAVAGRILIKSKC